MPNVSIEGNTDLASWFNNMYSDKELSKSSDPIKSSILEKRESSDNLKLLNEEEFISY